ncbi:F-box/LRR-repeat protein 4-like isoform X2 [Stegodyphus dumicola]|uniref:F-box/LRR-repeat protein 4-like isoform X2 n=1 Tax=Stegodyphus dumicola TaxID=202533 RepID=UPI0015B2B1D7|nr:F-box/LRR-repeat protein 4-like isoform X2 [Stegodyphus dumicola]
MNSVENEEDELLFKLHSEASKRGSNALSLRAFEVVAFSSQYGCENSLSYTAENILGPATIYPRAGDHAYTFQMKTYGQWWNSLPSSRRIVSNLPNGTFAESQDFIEIRVEKRVAPLLMRVYEVYNPGAIVKILCYCYETERWVILWQGAPQILLPDKSHCFSVEFECINFLTDYYRIEFHHSHLQYYSEIDGIILYGEDRIPPSLPNYCLAPKNFLYPKDAFKHVNNSTCNQRNENGPDGKTKFSAYFETLPKEVMHLILGLLDFKTLCIAAQVSRLFRTECYDPIVCKEINLNLYWHLVLIRKLLKDYELTKKQII